MLGKTEKVILGIILFIGAALRIYNYWDFSLSNDELSALARLNFDSFTDLIMNGVRIDGHPPVAQVILWYVTKWFGNGVAVVRLPFVLAGILSVWFMFRLAKEWVSTSAGLLSAATFATLEFPILYSRIARPYALGMLFALMAAFFWIRIVKQRHKPSDYMWLALSFALCAYSHFFSAMVAAILAFSGTFLIRGQNLKFYFLALVGAFLLYLPYIPIFLHQLSLGGVGQWLSPPENDWLWQHIKYDFNDSYLVLSVVSITGIVGFVVFRKRPNFTQVLLPLLLFFIPFLVGFSYSKWINPVLQNSTLLFSFPFLLVFIFSGWEDLKPKLSYAFISVILLVTIYSTSLEKQFYQTDQFGVFKELAQHVADWNEKLDGRALCVGDFNHPFYINYYLERIEPTEFALYRATDETGLAELKSIVDSSKYEYLIYSWSTIYQIPEAEAIIREKFPVEVERKTYFNSEAVLFKKGERDNKLIESFPFEKNEKWNLNPEMIQTDSAGSRWIQMTGENPYGPTFMAELAKLREQGFSKVEVKLVCSGIDRASNIQVVYEQVNSENQNHWESHPFKAQFKENGPNWGVFAFTFKDIQGEGETMKIYPWTPDGEWLKIYLMEVRFR